MYSSAILSLAKELAATHRVFYVDHPFTLKDFIARYSSPEIQRRRNALLWGRHYYMRPADFPERFIAVTPRMVVPVNFLPDGRIYDMLSAFNDRLVFHTMRRLRKDFQIRKFIFINSLNPFYGRSFPDFFRPELFIYQTRDDISQARYAAKHGVRLEQQMAQRADVVLATSNELQKKMSAFNPNTFLFPNAADTELFKLAAGNQLPCPPELQGKVGKIVLYMGNIGWARVDFPLLRKIAERKDWLLVLVGPTDSEEHIKAGLDKMPNVIFTGPKKLQALAAYVAYANCTLIPFQCNTLTKSIYPLKINEYLAAGKPVVTTAFSSDLYDFKSVAYIAKSHEEFIQLIEKAMQEDSAEKQNMRIKVAEQNSWKARTRLFWDIVNRSLSGKSEKGKATNRVE
ncbi:MAG: hypothetical protein KatS3mg031_0330 [Chitinophagales bacterium]|nr:MAG: hypothetical protein KatS3mg031_0330 [Chitinophagales bacterium]